MAGICPYDEPQTSYDYNKFFHPNLCHVCKKRKLGDILITCNRCFLISYCNEEHRNLHLPQHRDICLAAETFLARDPTRFTRRFTLSEWFKAQNEFLLSVRRNIGRSLQKYEIDMFMLANSCLICYQQSGLYTCDTCYTANYCGEHTEQFKKEHDKVCDSLTLWLNLELPDNNVDSINALQLKFMRFPEHDKSFHDMNTFITQYVMIKTDVSPVWSLSDYICSDYVSGPLTLYYGMQNANLLHCLKTGSTCIIHVIAANTVDRNGLAAWEILLHFLPNIHMLIIVMIGPKSRLESGVHNVCQSCTINQKKFIYVCCTMFYYDYLSSGIYKQPNMIVGFQPLLKYGLAWPQSIKAMQTRNCPLLLTEDKRAKTERDVNAIQRVLGSEIKPIYFSLNKYMSQKPNRCHNHVTYRNKYLIIYETLHNLSEAQQ